MKSVDQWVDDFTKRFSPNLCESVESVAASCVIGFGGRLAKLNPCSQTRIAT